MEIASLTNELKYLENKPAVTVLLKTKTTKELRILMKAGQVMEEHQAPFPIVVEVFDGVVDFGVNGNNQLLKKGDLIALEGNVLHDLHCIEDSIVRLSLSIADSVRRVKNIS